MQDVMISVLGDGDMLLSLSMDYKMYIIKCKGGHWLDLPIA